MTNQRKPTESEDEYFARLEMDRLRDAVKAKQAELAETEREEQRKLHWMKCPKCGTDLNEITLQNVKIDKCLGCEGVFLDKGELEQLIQKPEGLSRFFDFILG